VTQVVKVPDGRRLSVESLGDPDGKPVFLLHGTPGGRNGPRPRGIVFHRLGIRLLSYDRPGYPGSDRLRDRKVADAAIDVEAIADYFEIERFSVVGRSGGAPHALACAGAARLNTRVICAAALCSLAPYNAEGLDWKAGMADSNVTAYREAEKDLPALIATLNERAVEARNSSEGLLKTLWPELGGPDRNVIGDIALRRIIARNHVEALNGTIDGWIDDVLALSHDWGFDLSGIIAPVKLWSGSRDVFSPITHSYWLEKHIDSAELEEASGAAHFGAVEVLPKILTWVAEKMNLVMSANHPPATAAVSASYGFESAAAGDRR
jgi:pimeloyl-ACP methyl ester carboxylesterase